MFIDRNIARTRRRSEERNATGLVLARHLPLLRTAPEEDWVTSYKHHTPTE